MKKILMIALLLALTTGTAIAKQQRGSGPSQGRGGDPVEHLTEQLGLDVDQVAAITFIYEDTQTVREEEQLRSHEIMCEIRADWHTQVLEVLTVEQQVQFEALRQSRDELKRTLEEARADHGFGGGREKPLCDS